MCGIAGRFNPDSLSEDPGWHERAGRLLAHRGPDGSGHYKDDYCEFVHRRLALLDLTPTGSQPMCNEDEDVYVVCNGEIYNYKELRAELKRNGHMFRGTSDVEVLAHLFEEHGARMIEKIRGMFAFAVYDVRERRLFLARDRFGIKPLYYATHRGQLVFASEIKAILAVSGFEPGIDRQACFDYLGLGYVPEPATGFSEIKCLEAGTTLLAGSDGVECRKYFEVKADAADGAGRTLGNAVESVSSALLSAVRAQTVADVPVAALLSGGIDSSLVVAAYCRGSKRAPATFNVRFPDKEYDETRIAEAAARYYGTRHETIDLGESAMEPEEIFRLLGHFDQPFADTSLIPAYWVSRSIRDRGIICTLSGDGGDEAFGGYARFWRANTLARLMKLPRWLQDTTIAAGRFAARYTTDWGRQISKAASLAQAAREDLAVLLAGLSNYLSEDQKRSLVKDEAAENMRSVYRHFDHFNANGSRGGPLTGLSIAMTENLFAVGLPSDMLRKIDMMSMLAGIEVRVPMLAEEVVSIGLTLPHRLKTDGRKGKLVLRALANRWLPAEVASHPKHGFSIPVDRMVTKSFERAISDLLLSSDARTRSFLNVPVIAKWLGMFNQSRQGRRGGLISRGGLYQRVFIVLALELWMREHGLSW